MLENWLSASAKPTFPKSIEVESELIESELARAGRTDGARAERAMRAVAGRIIGAAAGAKAATRGAARRATKTTFIALWICKLQK
jgi:hypothetical protein